MASLSTLRVLANSDPYVFAEAIKKYGLRVVGLQNRNPLETRVQSESVSAIASTLTEDIDDPVDLPRQSVDAMRIAEEYGYIVKVLEEMDLPPEPEEQDILGLGIGGGTAAPAKPKEKPGVKPGRAPGKDPKRKPFNPPRPQKDPAPKACGGM
jgi:hypothetical protein